jgi:hypothetical protein
MKTIASHPYRVLALLLTLALLCTGLVLAQRPERDISGRRHPNLAAAQRLCAQAYQRITDAQAANEWDMAGHAAKAKELLDQVNHELKEAAEEANEHHH